MAAERSKGKGTRPAVARDAQPRDGEARLAAVVNHVLDAIITIDEFTVVQSFNPAAERVFGYTVSEVIGKNVKMLMPEPFHGEHDGYVRNYLETGEAKIIGTGREISARRKDGSEFPAELSISEMHVGERRMFVGSLRDITERRAVERTIAEQNDRLLAALSTPTLKVWDQVILMPLVGTIDADRASQIIENLLQAIVDNDARVAVIDVTGVPTIDTFAAGHLLKTVAAAEMLGAKVLITGITPNIAQTLVKLGIDLSTIRAFGPLRAGIAEALALTGTAFGETAVVARSKAAGAI